MTEIVFIPDIERPSMELLATLGLSRFAEYIIESPESDDNASHGWLCSPSPITLPFRDIEWEWDDETDKGYWMLTPAAQE